MDYILIYNMLEPQNFNVYSILRKSFLDFIFFFIMVYFSMKNNYTKKTILKIYFFIILFPIISKGIHIMNINKMIANKDYLKIEGKIYNYKTTSHNFESFYVNNHKFQSSNRYGFDYKYKGDKVIFKDGYRVKIYYNNSNNILKFWIEYKATPKRLKH